MEQIIIVCSYLNEIFYNFRRDVDYLRGTSIDFKTSILHRKIIFPSLHKSVIYITGDALKKYNGRRNIISSHNYSIKEIIERGNEDE